MKNASSHTLRSLAQPRLRDLGMSTAEYAIGTIAAAMFAAGLYKIANSEVVSDALRHLVERALVAPQ
ncbi:DUF4244 domain-containing protein [Streptomyces sp. NBRC 109706]|uniref:DUF4244 domain-containing protein n=1 Tax=Streptomyces sp. NBRC 109706 TaxID=1550035 RepID=UPI00099B3C6D|nr:DUF4244 domain-containing protein [Streptomyces sp. NBRC 109706]